MTTRPLIGSAPPRHSAEQLLRSSLPQLLLELATAAPSRLALRSKRRGLYRERSWSDVVDRVWLAAMQLTELGFQRGDRLAIIGDACEQWLFADLACQCLGGITFGIYPTAALVEVEYQLHDGGAVLVVAENQEYVDKVLAVADRLPALRKILVCDQSAMFAYRDDRIVAFAQRPDGPTAPARQAATAGRSTPRTGDDDGSRRQAMAWLSECGPQVRATDPAFIVYTSGTTGHPKGALISHGRHLAGTYNLVEHYPELTRPDLRTVAYLPLCHVLGRDIAVTLPLLSGLVPHYGESVDDLATTLFEVAPQVLFTVPRYLQKFASQLLIGVADSSELKKRVFNRALMLARAAANRRWQGGTGGAAYRLISWFAFRPALNKIGFDQLRLLISGGAPLPAETMSFWQMLGVNLCEIYGQTETGGAIISGQRSPFPRPGTVGELAQGIQIKLRQSTSDRPDEGEILLAGEYRFDGYWRNDEASVAAFEAGWLLTGDVGRYQNGQLTLVDRARDFIVTAGGKTLSPSAIESAIRSSRYVAEAVVYGHARKYLTALIEIDFDAVEDWARARKLSYSGFTGLSQHDDVRALLQTEIDRANQQLARVEQIKAFRILPKALDPEDEGEPVTPTRKVKRKQMFERFSDLIESMYDSSEEALLQSATGQVGALGRSP